MNIGPEIPTRNSALLIGYRPGRTVPESGPKVKTALRSMLERLSFGMVKRSKKSTDPNRRAFQVVQEATKEAEAVEETPYGKNPAAVTLGRLGGKKGGKARAESLSAKRRSEIARRAAQVRWAKEKNGRDSDV